MRITGSDKATKNLSTLQRDAQELHGEHRVAFGALYPPGFMAMYTDYATVDDMIHASAVSADTDNRDEALEALRDPAWNDFVSRHTRFFSGQEMLRVARREHVEARLFKGLRYDEGHGGRASRGRGGTGDEHRPRPGYTAIAIITRRPSGNTCGVASSGLSWNRPFRRPPTRTRQAPRKTGQRHGCLSCRTVHEFRALVADSTWLPER